MFLPAPSERTGDTTELPLFLSRRSRKLAISSNFLTSKVKKKKEKSGHDGFSSR